MASDRPNDPAGPSASAPRSAGRRRLLQGSAALAPAMLTVVSNPVRATYNYTTTPASSFASLSTSRPDIHHPVTGCKPSGWKNCGPNGSWSKWPASCKKDNGANPKLFRECFDDHATYGGKTLLECVSYTETSGEKCMVAHLAAAYLNACAGKVPAAVCSTGYLQDMWRGYKGRGYHEPTAGIKWRCDDCTPTGNGGITPWLKTTMPYTSA